MRGSLGGGPGISGAPARSAPALTPVRPRRRTIRLPLTGASAALLAALALTLPAAPAHGGEPGQAPFRAARVPTALVNRATGATGVSGRAAAGAWTAGGTGTPWTPRRLAAALPDEPAAAPDVPTSTGTGTAPDATRAAVAERSAGSTPRAGHIVGIPTVGVLFSLDNGLRAHYCTATVVDSPRRDLLMTAAHCFHRGRPTAFVPLYTRGALLQPYGIWPVTGGLTDPRRRSTGPGSDYDVAFLTTAPGPGGVGVEDVTGGDRVARTPGWRTTVTVLGYPDERASGDPSGLAVACTRRTSRLHEAGLHQLRFLCGGFYSGTSGGPWFSHFDPGGATGTVVGLVGGEGGGGPNDRVSYSPFFGKAVLALYRKATAG
jgi:hypothetical protein